MENIKEKKSQLRNEMRVHPRTSRGQQTSNTVEKKNLLAAVTRDPVDHSPGVQLRNTAKSAQPLGAL
jgi:hypothetical protein